jgi:hypothetical protein
LESGVGWTVAQAFHGSACARELVPGAYANRPAHGDFVDGVMNHLDPQGKVFPGSSALDFFT